MVAEFDCFSFLLFFEEQGETELKRINAMFGIDMVASLLHSDERRMDEERQLAQRYELAVHQLLFLASASVDCGCDNADSDDDNEADDEEDDVELHHNLLASVLVRTQRLRDKLTYVAASGADLHTIATIVRQTSVELETLARTSPSHVTYALQAHRRLFATSGDLRSTINSKLQAAECEHTAKMSMVTANHGELVGQDVGALLYAPELANLSDVTLVINQIEVKAHRVVLAARSSYFRRKIKTDLVSGGAAQSKAQLSVRIRNVQLDQSVVRSLIAYVYSGSTSIFIRDKTNR